MITTNFLTDPKSISAHDDFQGFYALADKQEQGNGTSSEDDDIENKREIAQRKIFILSSMLDGAEEKSEINSEKNQNFNNSKYADNFNTFYDTSYISTLALQYRIGINANCVNINNIQIEHNASKIDAAIKKNQANFHDFIDKINKQKHLSPFQRILKIISAIVTIVVSVVAILTTGPVGIALAAFLLFQSINDLYSGITGTSSNWLQQGITFIAKACGASDELAESIGMYASMAIVIVVTVATIVISLPAVFTKLFSSVGPKLLSKFMNSASNMVNSSASIATRVFGTLPKILSSMVANIIRLSLSITASAAAIGQATLGIIASDFKKRERLINAEITETNANIDILSKYRKQLSIEIYRQIKSFNDGIENILNVMNKINDGDSIIANNI